MNMLDYHENKSRGTFVFPIEFYYIDISHTRYQMPLHWHLEYELILILSGTFTLSLDSHTVLLESGDTALIPDGVLHGGIPLNCTYECIVFNNINRVKQSNGMQHTKHIKK